MAIDERCPRCGYYLEEADNGFTRCQRCDWDETYGEHQPREDGE